MERLYGIKRDYRAVSFTLLSAVVGVILMRIIVYFIDFPSGYGWGVVSDCAFTLPVQLIFFFAIPFLIYVFYGKRSVRQTLEYSSVGKFKPYYLLALPIGVCVWVITIGISSAWAALLDFTGYNFASSSTAMPEKFSFGFFVAEVVLTAVLPAVCEEFCMRGGTLTTAKSVFGTTGVIVFCGIAFGLFHQNIKQVFYTALFGAFAAFLTIKLKSIYPAMLMHFANNFCSVFMNYADNYNWAVGGGFYSGISSIGATRPWAIVLAFLAVMVIGFGLTFLMLYFKERKVIDNKREVIKDSAFDVTNKRVVLMGELDEKKIESLEMEKEVYGADYKEFKDKPKLREMAIIIAVGVVALCTTIFTYVWGFFY